MIIFFLILIFFKLISQRYKLNDTRIHSTHDDYYISIMFFYTISELADLTVSRRDGAHDEGVIVRYFVNVMSGPRILLDVDVDFRYMFICVEKVRAKQKSEFLRGLNTVFFCHKIDCVLLTVRGDDIVIVTLHVILLRNQTQVRVHLVFANFVM